MATYIMMSTLTDEGRKTLKERPERLQAVNKEVEEMGARVTHQYAVLGGYDFVNVIEAPSNEVMARISMELGARGTVKITTFPAMGIEEFITMMNNHPSPNSPQHGPIHPPDARPLKWHEGNKRQRPVDSRHPRSP